MMKGLLYILSESVGADILAFREHRSAPCFYAPNIDKLTITDNIKAEKEGIFTNFYPEDEWYKALAENFVNARIPDFEKPDSRIESVKRTLSLCSTYSGEKSDFPEICDATGFDGITYNSKSPKENIKGARKYDISDDAFYLYAASKRAEGASGEEFLLTDKGRKLLISMAFLEADIKRSIIRKDTSVLYKRARKCAENYFDYYYEGGTDKKEKGLLSKAYFKFSSAIFYLFGSNALQDDKFVI